MAAHDSGRTDPTGMVSWTRLLQCAYRMTTRNRLAIETVEVDGIEGLLKATLSVARSLPAGSFLWFRGHARASYTLLPGLLRQNKLSSEVFDREKRLLTRFRQRSLPYWPSGYPQNDWEHLFAMQHYGIPTRLLDWTENLFVAIHFALSVRPIDPADPPILWCIDPVAWNRATPVLSEYGSQIQVLTTSDEESEAYRPDTNRRRNKSPVAIFGTHNSARIVAQRGTFLVWGEDTRHLEDFAEDSSAKMWKFLIHGDHEQAARDLNALGFGETMIFPELGSLASELTRVEGWKDEG